MLAVLGSGVLVAQAAKSSKAKAPKSKQMKVACAGSGGVLRYVSRASKCKKSEKVLTLDVNDPIDACVKLHGTQDGVRGSLGQLRAARRLPAGTVRLSPPADCPAEVQPNEIGIKVPGPKKQWYCGRSSDGRLRWVSSRSKCAGRELPIWVPQGSPRAPQPETPGSQGNGNKAPKGNDDSATTDKDAPLAIDVLTNDTDDDGDPLSVESVNTNGTTGTVTANPNGTITYDPAGKFDNLKPGQTAFDNFKYKVQDNHGGHSGETRVDVTIKGKNLSPKAVNDSSTTDEATAKNVNVLANDTDAEGDSLTVGSIDDTGTVGDVSAGPGNTIDYDPNNQFEDLAVGETRLDTFKYRASDGNSNSAPATVTMTLTGVNDAPTVDTTNSTVPYTENVAAPVDSGVAVDDVDGDQISGATVAITNNFTGADGDTLGFINQNGITGSYNTGTGVLTLTGNASVADYQTALRSVTFNETSQDPATATRTVSFKVKDQHNADSNTDTRDVAINRVNDAPVNTVASTQLPLEDNPLTVIGAYAVNDVDAGGDDLKTTLSTGHGDIDVDTTGAATVTGQGSHSVDVEGTIAEINDALDDVTYTPDTDFSGADTLTMATSDLGHNPAPAQTDSDNVTYDVQPVNDAPSVTRPATATTDEDTAKAFATGGADEISIADVDSGTDDVKVDLSTSHGNVTLTDLIGLTSSTGNGTHTVSLTGPRTEVNEALDGLTYAPDLDYNGSDTLSVAVDDLGHNGSGGNLTDSKSVAITVSAVNDAPVSHVPGAQTFDEDTSRTFSLANGNNLSVSDVDLASGSAISDLTVDHGTLTVNGSPNGLTGNGTNHVTFTETQSQTAAALNGLVYAPDPNFAGTDTLTYKTDDQGQTGSGGAKTDTETVTLNVSAVNDAPVNSVPGADSTPEDTPYILSSGSSPSVDDVDAPTLKVTYSSTHGTMSLDPADLGPLTFSTGDGTDDATMTFTGTKAAINDALNGSKFTPDANFFSPPNAVITLTSDDEGATGSGGPLTDTDTIDITVNSVNDPPTVDTTDTNAAFTEGQAGAIEIDPGVTVADVDDTNIESATVKITAGHQASDVLNLPGSLPAGVTFNHVAGSDTLTITGTATLAQYQAMLQDVTFFTPSTSPGASRTVRFTVNDGDDDSPATNATRDIDITNTNDKPVIGATDGTTVSYAENDPATTLAPSATVNDTDSPNLTGGTVTITNFVADDELSFTDQGPVQGSYNTSTGELTITGTGTLAQYQAFVRSVKYRTTDDAPDTTQRQVAFQVTDGEPSNGLSDVATVNVNVSATNDPVVVTTTAGNTAYAENDPATTVDGGVTVTDVDSPALDHGRVAITTGFQSGDVLTFVNPAPAEITASYNSGTGVLTASGASSSANYQALFQSVKYSSTSDAPGSSRVVTFTAADGPLVGSEVSATKGIAITQSNDAPVVTVPAAQSVDEDTDLTFPGNVSVADADAGTNDVRLTLGVTNGTLTLSTTAGLTFQSGANGTGAMVVDGTLAELNAALNGLKYKGTLNFFGSDTLSVSLNDLGNTGGAPLSDSESVAITVNPVNDAPVAVDETFNGTNSAVGNTTLNVNDTAAHGGAPDGRLPTPDPTDTSPVTDRPHKEITGDIIGNDTDVDNANNAATVTAGTFNTKNATTNVDDGGTVTIQSDGDFNFEPPPGCPSANSYFDYTVNDNDGADPKTDTGRVTFASSGCVWYVNNDDAQGDNGTSEKPFSTLAQAETPSAANHSIFVYDGNNTTSGYAAGINLKSGQKLIGEAATLTVGSDTLHSADSANKPTITDTTADVVDLDDGNEVKGFNIDPLGGGGIAGSSGDTGGGTIDDVNIVDTLVAGTQPGLELDSTTGTFNISNLTVNNSAATGQTTGSIGVKLNNAGTVNFLPTGTVSITTAGAKGLDATGATTNMGTGSQFDDITVTGSGTGGVNMDSTVGTTNLGDGSGTDLNLTTTSGAPAALRLNNAGTVNALGVGTDAAHATGGPAVDVSQMPTGTTLDFDEVDSSSSAGTGISVDNSAGTVTLRDTGGDGSDIQNATGADVSLTGNGAGDTVDFTYDGAVTDSTGQVVSVGGQNGGTKDFNGPVSSGTVAVNGDAGATTRFDGGLTLSTAGSNAFSASTGGTVAVTDANGAGNTPDNTLATTTGTALSFNSTTIHDDDLTFRSIDASDPATSGIVLNTTSNANGRLVVTGNSSGVCGGDVSTGNSGGFTNPTVTNPNTADCTGGTIASAGTAGVSLNSVPGGASLTRMRVTGAADDGINANTVGGGVTLDHVLVDTNGGAAGDRGLEFTSVTGTSAITTSSVTGSADDNANWQNDGSGTLALTVANSRFADNSATTGADGLQFRGGTGSPTMTASIHDNAFIHNRDDGFQSTTATPSSSAQLNITFNNNDIVQGVNNVPNNADLQMGPGSSSDTKFKMDNNDLTGSLGSAVILNPGPDSTNQASFDAIVTNNSIGTGAVDSGSTNGIGLWGRSAGNGVNRYEIRNNLIQNYQQQGMYLYGNEGVGQQTDYTVTGNTIGAQDGDALVVFLEAGAVSGDSTTACFDLGGSGALANTIFNRPTGNDIGVATAGSSTMKLVGWPGGQAINPALTNYFIGRNSPNTLTAIAANSFTPVNAANCALPATPPLP